MKIRSSTTWLALVLSTFVFLSSSFASENVPGGLKGTGIELFERGHTFSGSILETPVFGVFQENPFGATVQIRKENTTLTLTLTPSGKLYLGEVSEKTVEGQEIKTLIQFEKVTKSEDKTKAVIYLNIDGKSVPVQLSGESFTQGHFQKPKFEAVIGEKTILFTFSGQACFGYSINLAMMVLGTYAHLLK